jgi:uncharacterized membrane protein YdjX (TVP38/TMEM64 family)
VTRKAIWKLLLAAAGIAAIVVASLVLPLGSWIDTLVTWVRGEGVLGILAFSVVTIVLTQTLLPTAELFLGAGLIYGTWWGAVLMTAITFAAGMLGFWLGRSGFRRRIEKHLSKHERLAALDDAIDDRAFWIAFLLRLSPVMPFGALNYALAATKISTVTYITTLLAGMVPCNLAFAYAGHLLHDVSELSAGGSGGALKHVMLWGGIAATLAATVLVGLAAKRALSHAEHAHPSHSR